MEKTNFYEIDADKLVEALAVFTQRTSPDELRDALKGHKLSIAENTIEQIKQKLGPLADPIFDQPPRSGGTHTPSGNNQFNELNPDPIFDGGKR